MAKLDKNDHKGFNLGVKIARGAAGFAAAAGALFLGLLAKDVMDKKTTDSKKDEDDGDKA